MVTKAIRTTYDGHSFHVTEPIDIATNSECLIYIEQVEPQKTPDAIDYLFSIAGTAHGPPDQSLEHDHYLYGTPKKVNRD